jgi:saccharopine dehydrogenase-like NADP-dependent oxidoreductase
MLNQKKVVIFGSGLVAEPLLDYLLQREENYITVASNNVEQAKEMCYKKYTKIKKERLVALYIDVVKEHKAVENLIKNCDLVISLIPAFLHIYVSNVCLELKKNLLTTSYISDELRKMSKKIKDSNLIFMYETGVNPGLDHIIAYKVIREIEELGHHIIGYESWVGALPSPDFCDNPLLYKISWSTKGSLLALKHDAKQLINGKIVSIPEKNVLTSHLVDKKFHPSFNFEGYYNRDSIRYKDLYNLKDAKTVIRGLIRYSGFTFVFQCLKFLNMYSFDKIDPNINTWREYLSKLLKNPRIQDTIFDMKDKYIKKGLEMFVENLNLSDSLAERMFYYNLSLLAISNFDEKYIKKYGFEVLFGRIYSALIYLAFYKDANKVY